MTQNQRDMRLVSVEQRLAEVRKRMITDYYTGTSPNSPHYWVCRVCDGIWTDGEVELHRRDCPITPLQLQPPAQSEAQALLTDEEIGLPNHVRDAYDKTWCYTHGCSWDLCLCGAQLAKATPIIEQRVLDACEAEYNWHGFAPTAKFIANVKKRLERGAK